MPTNDPLDPGKAEIGAKTLARAAHDDPAMAVLAPKEEKRGKALKALFTFSVDYFLRFGRIDSRPERTGAARGCHLAAEG